jgi:pyridinium-3,5-bisthiocarboxylic acid mononucleotide nickel chelatase
MSVIYLDIFSGISGDMFVGALVDAGVDFRKLEHELGKLGVAGYHLHVGRGIKQSISGTKFDVHLEHGHGHEHHHPHARGHEHEHSHSHALPGEHEHEHEHGDGHKHSHPHRHVHGETHSHEETRSFADIRELFAKSDLSGWVKSRAISTFERIAVAEGSIHGVPAEEVHFHEVGAVDSIVDIAGACIALEMLGKPRVIASPVVEGTGFIKCAHGRFPIPAPATLAILAAKGIQISQCEEPHELVTPTGAALLAEFVESFGPMRNLAPRKIGIGLGSRDNLTRPNVLRVVLGEEAGSSSDWETDTVCVLETNIDDLNPEVLGMVLEKAMTLGALDAYHTPVQMKKSRPGVVLTILCTEQDADRFSELLLIETSAFGVRRTLAERRKLKREFRDVQTVFGNVRVKLGFLNGRRVQCAPEFDSCRKVAEQKAVPVKEVYAAAIAASQDL